jgi:hypothetical protein
VSIPTQFSDQYRKWCAFGTLRGVFWRKKSCVPPPRHGVVLGCRGVKVDFHSPMPNRRGVEKGQGVEARPYELPPLRPCLG